MLGPLTGLASSLNAVLLQEMIIKIHNRQMGLEDVMANMCSSRVDSYLVHLLRAITANELWRKQDHYKTFIPGIDAYGSVPMTQEYTKFLSQLVPSLQTPPPHPRGPQTNIV